MRFLFHLDLNLYAGAGKKFGIWNFASNTAFIMLLRRIHPGMHACMDAGLQAGPTSRGDRMFGAAWSVN